jgi:hypothetical protein
LRDDLLGRRAGACGQIQSRRCDQQVETPWPSASRIEMKHAAKSLDPGPMRVAVNDDVNPARGLDPTAEPRCRAGYRP